METEQNPHAQPRSHLFLVRLWQEQLDDEQTEWRGRVLHALTGHEIYFRDWNGLIAILQKMIDLSPVTQVDESLPEKQ